VVPDQQLTGRWWIPPASDLDETGILRIGPKGDLELDLNGTLGRRETLSDSNNQPIPIVWGLTRKQELVTLLDLVRTASSFSAPGYPTETFRPNFALIGALLGLEDLRFTRVGASFPGLGPWIGKGGLSETIGHSVKDWRIEVDPPAIETFSLADGTDVTVDFSYRTERVASERLGIRETVYVTFHPKQPADIEDCTRLVSQLRDLLTVSCGQALTPDSIRLFCPTRLGAPDTDADPNGIPITLYRAMVSPDSEGFSERKNLDYMVTAAQHPDGLTGAIRRWFALYEQHSPAISIVSGLHYAPQVLRDPELLLALVVAEAYHRASSFPQAVTREEIERWNALLRDAPATHAEWLKNFIAEREEPSLRRRLNDMVRHVGPIGKTLTATVPSYAYRANIWRNAFVHTQQERSASRLSGAHLLQLAWITRLLVELALLADAGFTIAGSDSILNHPRFRLASSLRLNWPSLAASQSDDA
jgi:hypothetical protein